MLVWLTLSFYDYCGFRFVTVNNVYKLQFVYIYRLNIDNVWRPDIRLEIPESKVGLKSGHESNFARLGL